MKTTGLDPVIVLLRRRDPDRYYTALFAPAVRRPTLLLLYAVNAELARARIASQPTLGLIRLQWWREVIEGQEKRHEIATPLRAAIGNGAIDRDGLLAVLAAHEAEIEETEAPADGVGPWIAQRLAGDGALAEEAGRILGAGPSGLADLRRLGAAYGIARILRNRRFDEAAGRSRLPVSAAQHVEAIAQCGAALLAEAGYPALPDPGVAAALVGVLAARDLRRPDGTRGTADRLAVAWAAFSGNRRPAG